MLTYLQQPKITRRFLQNSLRRIFHWRVLSVFLLGFCSNLLVNIILDFKYQRSLISLSLEETINAVLAAFILLEGMRWITKILDVRLPWEKGVRKRLVLQLGMHLAFLIVVLNLLLISVTFAFYGGFYALGDLIVINISFVSLAFFFSIIDTGIFFFFHWRKESKVPEFLTKGTQKPLKITSGKSSYLINQHEIHYARYQSGLVMISTGNKQNFSYGSSLDNLMSKLEGERFFKANRQIIVNRSIVNRLTSLDHGKIKVELKVSGEEQQEVIVSRSKASGFRKWIDSNVN
ncbi:MAG: LytTR family DNA-binding domain-containing protein [Ekhidna sp.]